MNITHLNEKVILIEFLNFLRENSGNFFFIKYCEFICHLKYESGCSLSSVATISIKQYITIIICHSAGHRGVIGHGVIDCQEDNSMMSRVAAIPLLSLLQI